MGTHQVDVQCVVACVNDILPKLECASRTEGVAFNAAVFVEVLGVQGTPPGRTGGTGRCPASHWTGSACF